MNYCTAIALLLLLLSAPQLWAQDYAEVKQLLHQGKYKDIETILQARLKSNPNDDSAYYYLGLAYFHQEKLDEAVRQCEKCLELNPNSSLYHLALAQALGRSVQKSGIFAQLGSVGRIKGAIEKAVALDPRSLNARFALVSFHLQAPGIVGGSWDEAVRQAKAFESIDPNKARLLWSTVHFYKKEYDKCIDQFLSASLPKDELARELYRSSFVAIAYRAASELLRKKDFERIIAVSQKLLTAVPDLHYSYALTGQVLMEKGQYDEAITQFEKALSLSKRWVAGHYQLGIAYQARGDKDKAIAAFEKFLSLEKQESDLTKDARERLEKLKK